MYCKPKGNGSDSKTYAKALRASLREDPDVIFIGEMRDIESISIAVTAAETGHLVLSTLHTLGGQDTRQAYRRVSCRPATADKGTGFWCLQKQLFPKGLFLILTVKEGLQPLKL